MGIREGETGCTSNGFVRFVPPARERFLARISLCGLLRLLVGGEDPDWARTIAVWRELPKHVKQATTLLIKAWS